MRIANNLLDLIGNTPLMRLTNYLHHHKLYGDILVKLEYFNPLSSVKDRAGLAMIQAAEQDGLIDQQTTIIEPTSGNTGIALAYICAIKGYKLILTMPETMSLERRNILKALGAQLVLTEGVRGMNGAIEKASELARDIPNSFIPQQFENPANPQIHKQTTAREIWQDTGGEVDFFVSAVGTGGTLTGTAQGLKQHNENIKIIAVEPSESPVISGGNAGPHGIQGIGAGFIPKILQKDLIDQVITVTTQEAVNASRQVARMEGLLVGISSGAALAAATRIAMQPSNTGKKIITILPDGGERYLSTQLFDFKENV